MGLKNQLNYTIYHNLSKGNMIKIKMMQNMKKIVMNALFNLIFNQKSE